MNKKLLKSEMILHDDTNVTLAAALGISAQSVSNKINENNSAEFTQGEMAIIRDRYQLSDSQFMAIFFADFVS